MQTQMESVYLSSPLRYLSYVENRSLPPVDAVSTSKMFSLIMTFAIVGTAGAILEKASTPTDKSSSNCTKDVGP